MPPGDPHKAHRDYLTKLRLSIVASTACAETHWRRRASSAHVEAMDMAERGAVIFSHGAGTKVPMKYKQGSYKSNTAEAFQARFKLRREPQVLESLQRFWMAAQRSLQSGGDESASVLHREGYMIMMKRVFHVLIEDPDLHTCSSLDETVAEEWEHDMRTSTAANGLSREAFCDALFELADTWCIGICSHEYAHFLDDLFERVTIREIQSDTAGGGPGAVVHYIWKEVPDCAYLDCGSEPPPADDNPRHRHCREARIRQRQLRRAQASVRRAIARKRAKKRRRAARRIVAAARRHVAHRAGMKVGGGEGWRMVAPDTDVANPPRERPRCGALKAGTAVSPSPVASSYAAGGRERAGGSPTRPPLVDATPPPPIASGCTRTGVAAHSVASPSPPPRTSLTLALFDGLAPACDARSCTLTTWTPCGSVPFGRGVMRERQLLGSASVGSLPRLVTPGARGRFATPTTGGSPPPLHALHAPPPIGTGRAGSPTSAAALEASRPPSWPASSSSWLARPKFGPYPLRELTPSRAHRPQTHARPTPSAGRRHTTMEPPRTAGATLARYADANAAAAAAKRALPTSRLGELGRAPFLVSPLDLVAALPPNSPQWLRLKFLQGTPTASARVAMDVRAALVASARLSSGGSSAPQLARTQPPQALMYPPKRLLPA